MQRKPIGWFLYDGKLVAWWVNEISEKVTCKNFQKKSVSETEGAALWFFVKNLFLIFFKIKGKQLWLIALCYTLNFIVKVTPVQVFSRKIYQSFKKNYFSEHLRTSTFVSNFIVLSIIDHGK